MDKEQILQNFLNENAELSESVIKEVLAPYREKYIKELQAPGCTGCLRASLKRKYTAVVDKEYQNYLDSQEQ